MNLVSSNKSCPKGYRFLFDCVCGSEARFHLPTCVRMNMECQGQCEVMERSKDPHRLFSQAMEHGRSDISSLRCVRNEFAPSTICAAVVA
jgi:hypothetical protein